MPLKLFGPGTDSGTFDYFTEKINGKAKASRSDYLATEDDNVLVQGVEGERGGLGYFGFSYYEENKAKLKAREGRPRHRLRRAERRDGAEQHVQAALTAALHLREAHLVQAPRSGRLHRLHLQQREGDREAGRLHRAHRPPAAQGALPVPAGPEGANNT